MKRCPKCDAIYNDSAQFCLKDGFLLLSEGNNNNNVVPRRSNMSILGVVAVMVVSLSLFGLMAMLGMFPYFAYSTQWSVLTLPLLLALLFFTCLLFHVLVLTVNANKPLKGKKWIPVGLSVVPPVTLFYAFYHMKNRKVWQLVWIPLVVFFAISAVYCYNRYKYNHYNDYGRIITVKKYDKGLADELGNDVLEPGYKTIIDKGNLIYYKNDGVSYAIYDVLKHQIVLPEGQNLFTFAEIYEMNDLYGIRTKYGDDIIEPIYDYIDKVSDDDYKDVCFIVKKGGKYGILNKYGLVSLECRYDHISMDDYFLIFMQDGKKGLISRDGESILQEALYDDIDEDSGYVMFKKDGKWGLFDLDGKEIIQNPVYDEIKVLHYNNGPYILYQKSEYLGLFNKDGSTYDYNFSGCRFDEYNQDLRNNKDWCICLKRTGQSRKTFFEYNSRGMLSTYVEDYKEEDADVISEYAVAAAEEAAVGYEYAAEPAMDAVAEPAMDAVAETVEAAGDAKEAVER